MMTRWSLCSIHRAISVPLSPGRWESHHLAVQRLDFAQKSWQVFFILICNIQATISALSQWLIKPVRKMKLNAKLNLNWFSAKRWNEKIRQLHVLSNLGQRKLAYKKDQCNTQTVYNNVLMQRLEMRSITRRLVTWWFRPIARSPNVCSALGLKDWRYN